MKRILYFLLAGSLGMVFLNFPQNFGRNNKLIGYNNIAIGYRAGINLTKGDCNIILGDGAGQDIDTESYWLVIGSFRWKMTPSEWRSIHDPLIRVISIESAGWRLGEAGIRKKR